LNFYYYMVNFKINWILEILSLVQAIV